MTTTDTSRPEAAAQVLAINGGPKAFPAMQGKVQGKVGVEELFALAERFGMKPEALKRLRASFTDEDLEGNGPTLSRYLTTFPTPASGERLERMVREMFQVPHAVMASSGTGGLHAAMMGVGARPGTDVIVPALGFIATGAAAALCGATPVFCDVDESLQMDPASLEARLTPNTVAIVPTHYLGMVADMKPILDIARRRGIPVIEDAAQSPGARYQGKLVGTIGDIGCFSISAYKIIGGSEGGMVLARDQRIFDRINQLIEGGGLWRESRFAPERYEGELFVGGNYRMSELESTVNLVQFQKLPEIVQRTQLAYRRVTEQLTPVGEVRPQKINDRDGIIGPSIRMFPRDHALREKLVVALKAEGIPAGSRGPAAGPDWHLGPDMFPLRRVLKPYSGADDCPVANDLFHREISVGVNQWWSPEDCDAVAHGINKVLAAYCTRDPQRSSWH